MSLQERCLKEARFYQRRFPSVIPLSSSEFLRDFHTDEQPYQLVDCRSDAERLVSVIAGSSSTLTTDDPIVVCYCTIGFRSGLEASRIKQLHPDWTVYNLDGIVAFSLAVAEEDRLQLVTPDGERATHVHIFAGLWNFVDPEKFQAVAFSLTELPMRYLQVGCRVAVRTGQSLIHCCCSCC